MSTRHCVPTIFFYSETFFSESSWFSSSGSLRSTIEPQRVPPPLGDEESIDVTNLRDLSCLSYLRPSGQLPPSID